MSSLSSNPKFEITTIPASQTYPIREAVLRPGRPREECIFEGDEEKDTLHLLISKKGNPAGIASFMLRENERFEDPIQVQLRGMAILPEFQGKGLGKLLLREGEELLLRRHKEFTLWFNARESAVGFYRRYGYNTLGEPFMIPNVCMHIVMFRRLASKEKQ